MAPVWGPGLGSMYLVAAVQVLQVLRLWPQERQASLGPGYRQGGDLILDQQGKFKLAKNSFTEIFRDPSPHHHSHSASAGS